jgi:Na+(H+)/acetate symporter ActP
MNIDVLILLLIALAAANLPFMSGRVLFFIRPKSGRKSPGWCLLELVLLYFAAGVLAWLVEKRTDIPHHQGWEFYAVTACLFLVFAFPGFVLRYLLRHRAAPHAAD